jgi:RNA polymerase sigma factor (sigma-70 family)
LLVDFRLHLRKWKKDRRARRDRTSISCYAANAPPAGGGDDPMGNSFRQLEQALWKQELADRPDRDLLESFLAGRDEAAFAALVRRHGPMVLGVCRRLVGHEHDAEDAFQAVFLVLARRAAHVARRELLANWLYGVARRTALEMRKRTLRRQSRERQVPDMPEPAAGPDAETSRELEAVLDRELGRLPDKYRVPIVLCDLQNRSRKEAAAQLRIPEGTLSSRLATGRQQLARRLARRGLFLSAPLLGVAVAQCSAGELTPALVCATAQAGVAMALGKNVAAGVLSPRTNALANKILTKLWWHKMKAITALFAAILTLGGALTLLGRMAAGEEAATPRVDPKPAAPAVAQEDKAPPRPGPLRYDGKQFDTWAAVLQTELKAERLIEAIKAMQAFGINGYGKDAARTLIQFAGIYRSPFDDASAAGIKWSTGKDPVLKEVVDALKHIGEPALPAVQLSFKSTNPILRRLAMDVVSSVYPPSDKQKAFAEVRAGLKDSDEGVRYRAVERLQTFIPKDKTALDALALALKDESSPVRLMAIGSLFSAARASDRAVPVLILALRDPDMDLRRAAANALAQLKSRGRGAEVVAAALLEALGKPDHKLRLQVLEFLAANFARGDFRALPEAGAAVPALMDLFHKSKDHVTKAYAVQVLGYLGPAARAALPMLRSIPRPDDLEAITPEVGLWRTSVEAITSITQKGKARRNFEDSPQ